MATVTLLQRLRTRKAAIVRIAAPLIAAVWLGAPATTCAAMAAHAVAPKDHVAHEHDGEAAHGRHDLHAIHDAHAPQHEHAPHALHGTPDAHVDADGERSCPHCLGGAFTSAAGPGAQHVGCAALDSAADRAAAGISVEPDLKQIPLAPSTSGAQLRALRAPTISGATAPLIRSAVALHIRHCVFLI